MLHNRLGGRGTALLVWPGSEIMTSCVLAAMKVAQEVAVWKEPQTTQSTQSLAGNGSTTEFALASDWLHSLHVTLSSDIVILADSFRVINQEDPNDLTYSETEPICYLRSYYGASSGTGFIGILPALDTGVTATHHYIALPRTTDLGTALLDIPVKYHEAIAILAHWELAHKTSAGNPGVLRSIYQEYEMSLQKAGRDTHDFADRFRVMYDATATDRYTEDW